MLCCHGDRAAIDRYLAATILLDRRDASHPQEIRDHRLRSVVSRCPSHAAAGMRPRAAEIEPGDRHAVVSVSEHRPGGEKLTKGHRAMEDVAMGQAEDSMQIE